MIIKKTIGLGRRCWLYIMLLVISIVIEFMLSNYNYAFLGKERDVVADYSIVESDNNIDIVIEAIDFKVRNVELNYVKKNILTKYTIKVVLEGYAYTGEFTYNEKWADIDTSVIINMNWSDYVKKITISTPKENFIEPNRIILNSSNLRFMWSRFILIYGSICMFVLLKKVNSAYNYKMKQLTYTLMILFCGGLFLFLATECGIKGIFSVTPLMGQYIDDYSELTDSFLHGSANFINLVPDDKFLSLNNPYDYTERIAKGVSYPFDGSYYNGAFSSYFGVAPVLELMIPSYCFSRLLGTTGYVISTYSATLFYLFVIIILFSRLFQIIVVRFGLNLTKTEYILSYNAILLCSGFLQLLRGLKYDLAVASGLAHTLAAVLLAIAIVRTERWNFVKYFMLGLMLGLMVLSKPTFLFAYILIFYIMQEKISSKNIKNLCVCIVPLLGCAIFQMSYNYIRYGSIVEFGTTYLVGANMQMFGKLSLLKAVKHILAGIVTPPRFSFNQFPYLFEQASVAMGDLNCISICDSVIGLIYIPMLWILLFQRNIGLKGKEQSYVICAELVACIAFAFAFAKISINDEYLISPRFLLLFVAMVLWFKAKDISQQTGYRKIVGKSFAVTAILSILVMLPCSLTNNVSLLANFNNTNVWIRNVIEFWA